MMANTLLSYGGGLLFKDMNTNPGEPGFWRGQLAIVLTVWVCLGSLLGNADVRNVLKGHASKVARKL